jgi:adenylate cyclase
MIAVVAASIAALGLHVGAFQGFRQRAADGLFPTGVTDQRVAIVGIDARSLDELGQPWPWPRQVQADLVDRLVDGGAKVIVDDLVFAPPNDGDVALAASMQRGVPVVIAASASLQPDPDGLLLRTVARTDPAPALASASAAVAHASVTPDPDDGVVRSLPLLVEDDRGHFTPSLALAALAQLDGTTDVVLRSDSVVTGAVSVPTGERHSLTLSYSDALIDRAKVISAIDVLQGRADPDELRGKVVFVGTTDPTLGDTHLVPPNKRDGVPGVVIHASALNTMLTGAYLRTESSSATVLTVAIVALLASLLLLHLRMLVGLALVVVEAIAFAVLVLYRFQHGTIIDPVYPMAAIIAATVAALVVRYFTEVRQRRRVNALFASYVPATVAQQLVDNDLLDEVINGVRHDITVFFCDLRGFTPIAATLQPAEVRTLLDAYYEHVCSRILERDGTIMQFVGDEVFAVFGAPVARTDHAAAALECALSVQRDRPKLDEELAELGLPPVRFGIGLNSGEVVAAHVGPVHRRQYSVVGDTVNVGSRLCGQALADQVVAATHVLDRLDTPRDDYEDLGRVELKGVAGGMPAVRFSPLSTAIEGVVIARD